MKILKTILLIILYAFIYYFFQFVIGGIIGAFSVIIRRIFSENGSSQNIYMDYINNGMGNTLCITIIIAAVISFLIYFGIFLIRREKITRICNFKKIKFSHIPMAFFLGIAICLLNSSLLSWLAKIDFFKYYIERYQSLNYLLSNTNTILLVLAITVTAPLIEEVIFRGMIFNDLKQIMPVFWVIIIQGLLFGIYHFNIVQFIYGSFLGIMFGLVYNWAQNIWIPVILHFSNNLMAVIALKQPTLDNSSEPNIFVFFISLILTVLLCVFFYKRRSGVHSEE